MTLQVSTDKDLAFIETLESIDFGPIAFKMIHPDEGQGWTLEQATRAVRQYRQFLFLNYKYPERPIVPSREVDQVWHTHILDTEKYRTDCDRLFGHFLDHWPYFGLKDEAERQQLEDAFAETQRLLKQHFGS